MATRRARRTIRRSTGFASCSDATNAVLREGQLGFDRQMVWADVWALAALVQRIDSETLDHLDADQVSDLSAALCSTYRGGFAGANPAEPWAVGIADRCSSQFLRAMRRAGQRLEALSCWADAERVYRLAWSTTTWPRTPTAA